MAQTDERTAERLWRQLDTASASLRRGLPMSKGGAKAEQAYSSAYQALVQAGLAPQLRRKYRGR
jgi:hypothetical protein